MPISSDFCFFFLLRKCRIRIGSQFSSGKTHKHTHDFSRANHMRFTFVAQENLDYDAKNLAGVVEMYALETSFLGIMVFIFTFAYASLLKYVAQKQVNIT